MKLRRIRNDEIVTVRFAVRHYAVAEARELKAAGFGQRSAVRMFSGEWMLRATSYRDFRLLARAVPARFMVMAWSGGKPSGLVGTQSVSGAGDPARVSHAS